MEINIHNIISNTSATVSDDAWEVFDRIKQLLHNNMQVELSFAKITLCTPTFLNIAVGQLYFKYDHAMISNHLSVHNISPYEMQTLRMVIENAKRQSKEGKNDQPKKSKS